MNKKFISWVSAVALASSAIVVPLSANAEGETVLWSDTFNAYDIPEEVYGDWLTGVLIPGFQNDGTVYDRISGIGLKVGSRSGGDDSTYWTLSSKADAENDKYLTTATGRFATESRGAKFIFNEAQSATADNDIVLAFDLKGINCRDANVTYDRAFAIYNDENVTTVVDLDTANVAGVEWDDRATIGTADWSTVKVVVSTTGTKVYAGETEIASSTATSIKGIDFSVYINGSAAAAGSEYRIDGKGHGYPAYALDNVVLYSTAAGDGLASEIPAPQDQAETTPPPTAPPAAEITETTTIDFDTNTIEINNRSNSGRMNTSIGAVTDIGNDTMMGILEAVNPEDNGNCGAADINLSQYTKGKSHVILSYDFYMPDAGRFKVIASDAEVQRSKPTEMDNGIFMVGKTGSSGMTNVVASAWNTVTIDADFATGNVKYEVKSGDTTVTSGTTTTDKKELTYLQFASWSAVTAYVDNIKVQTGGEIDGAIATPEPASTVEGSGIDLLPENATKFADFTAAEGTAEKILNHTSAKPAVDAASVSIYADNANIRGKAVYAAYDVLVNAGDKLVIKAVGSDASKVGAQFALEGKADGTVDVYALVDKGDRVDIDSTLVCGTWYRVVIEIPQLNNAGATNTGNAIYTIYRINPNDPSTTAGVAAQKSGLTPRNLSDRAAVNLLTEVTGKPYIDNGVTYLKKSTAGTWYRYHFTKDETGIKTVTSVEEIDDPSKKSDELGEKYYIWNGLMQPYVPAAETPAE